jgi:hypothetical protein
MWTLVFINLMLNAQSGHIEPVIEAWYDYTTMEECFFAREVLLTEIAGIDAIYYPLGTQAVCIQGE